MSQPEYETIPAVDQDEVLVDNPLRSVVLELSSDMQLAKVRSVNMNMND